MGSPSPSPSPKLIPTGRHKARLRERSYWLDRKRGVVKRAMATPAWCQRRGINRRERRRYGISLVQEGTGSGLVWVTMEYHNGQMMSLVKGISDDAQGKAWCDRIAELWEATHQYR